MASSLRKQLELIVALSKDASKYQVKEIIEDLVKLQDVLGNLGNVVEQKLKLNITGIKDIKELQSAASSLNRTLGPVSGKLKSFFGSINSGTKNLNVMEIVKLDTALISLFQSINSLSIVNISKSFNDFVKSILEISKQTENIIKPFKALENSIDSLDKKMKTSLSTFSQYVYLFQKLETASGNVGANTKGARTPVFKTAEGDATALVGQYKKLSTEINNAGVSLAAFAKNSSLIKDAGFRDTLKGDIKTVTKNYSELQGVVAKLDATIQILSADEVQNAAALKVLRGASAEASKEQAKLNDIQKQAISANEALERSVRENKDAHNAMFNTLGGVIKRQIEFIASATLLASTFDFVRRGFTSTFEILTEVQRILVVSRSDFLSTSDTVKVLINTIETFATKTGESTQNIATVLKELGSAGLTTEQSVAALDSTLNNIIATDSSVTETTRLVASTYNILGNTVAGTSDQISNFTRINDVLARATNESSLELDQLVQALKFSLPASKEAGLRFEDLVGLLAQLADQGLKGGNAGRALRAALQQISKDAPAFAKAFNIDIPLDKPLQFLDIIQKFGDKIKGQDISAEELGTIFTRLGLRGADSFLLLGQGIDQVNKKIGDLKNNSKGVAEIGARLKIEAPERQFEILEQNINQISRVIFKPLVDALLYVVKKLNEFSDAIRIIGESSLFSFGAKLLLFVGIIKVVGATLSFLEITIESLSAIYATATSATALLAAGTTGLAAAFSTLTGSIAFVGVVLVLAGAFYYLASSIFDVFKNSKLLKKELDEQRLKSQEIINENNKMASSFEKISERILKNKESFEKGSITYQEYLNDLNNISSSSLEAGSIIRAYGGDALKSAESIKFLANERKKLVKSELAKQNIIDNDKLKESAKEFKKFKEDFDRISKSIKNLESTKISFKSDIKNQKIKELKNDLDEVVKSIQDLNNEDLSIIGETTNENTIKKIFDEIKKRKNDLGDPTGIGTEINKIPVLLDLIKARAAEITFDNANFSIKEFDGLIQKANTGVEGLSKKILFDFKVQIPQSFVKSYNDAIANIDGTVGAQQAGLALLNELNVDALAESFEKEFRAINLPVSTETIRKNLISVIDDVNAYSKDHKVDLFQQTDLQFDRIEENFSNIIDNEIKVLQAKRKTVKEEGEIANITARILELENNRAKIFAVISAERANFLKNDNLQIESAEQIYRTKQASLFLDKAANKITQNAGEIIRDVVAASNKKLSVERDILSATREQYKADREALKNNETNKDAIEKFHKSQSVLNDKLRTYVDHKEQERILVLKINTDLKIAQKALQAQRSVGENIVDQGRNRLEDIKDEVKLIQDKLILGYNDKEIQTELLKKDKESLIILQQISKEKLNDLTSIRSIINAAREEVSVHGDRLKIINNYTQAQFAVAKTEFDIANLGKKTVSNAETINNLERRLLTELTNQAKAKKDLNKLELISIENQSKLLEFSSKIAEKQVGLFADQKTKLGDNLKKLIEKNFEKNDFNETLKVSKALNLSMIETFGLFGDTSKKSDAFFRALEKGTINLSGYSDEIQEAGKVYQELNKQAKDFRKQQQQINEDKFKLFEASFANAVSVGGKEGFNQAENALNSLIGLADVYSDNGEKDNVKTLEKLKTIAGLREQITKIDVNATGLEKSPELVDKITEAVKRLNVQFDVTKGILKDIGINDINALNGLAKAIIDIVSGGAKLESKSLTPSPIGRARGGIVPGTGSGDIVPAMLTPGEFVIPKNIVDKKGLGFFYDLIGGKPAQGYALGGLVRGYEDGGLVDGSSGDQIARILAVIAGSTSRIAKNTGDILSPAYTEDLKESTRLTNFRLEYISKFLANDYNNLTHESIASTNKIGEKLDELNFFIPSLTHDVAKQITLEQIAENTDEANNILRTGLIIYNPNIDKMSAELEKINSQEAVELASGGKVPGVGSGDIIPALLTPGEFVIPKRIVEQKGLRYFEELIGGSNPITGNDGIMRLAEGGFADSGPISQSRNFRGTGQQTIFEVSDKKTQEFILAASKLAQEKQKEILAKFNEVSDESKKFDKAFLAQAISDTKAEKFPISAPQSPTASGFTPSIAQFATGINPASEVIAKKKVEEGTAATKRAVEANKRLIDSFHKLEGSIIDAYKSYKESVAQAGAKTINVFLKASVGAATRFLNKVEDIGETFERVFKDDIPHFLGQFLNDVVLSNVKILSDYKKQRIEIGKNYKNQRADLIEQLKRNEISYFDFFDKLENLKKDQNKTEIELEKKKIEDLEKQFQEATVAISRQIAEIVGNIGSTVGDAFSGLPALILPFVDAISAGLSSAFGAVGGLIGDGLDLAANIVGPVIGAAGQLFGLAFQGFASLIPLVTQIVTAPQAEFENFLSSIKEIPAELDKILFGFTDQATGVVQTGIIDRIPKIADALANNIVPIGAKFAEAIDKTFPLIAQAFSKIIPAALFAIIPVITSIFGVLPDFLLSVFLATSTQLPAFIALFISAAEKFFDFFNDNLPRIIDGIIEFAETFVNVLADYFETNGIDILASSFEKLGPQVADVLSRNAPQIAGVITSSVGVLGEALFNDAPRIGSGIIDGINKIIGGDNPTLKNVFNDLFKKLFESLTSLIPTLGSLFAQIFNSVIDLIVSGLKAGSQINEVFIGLLNTVISQVPIVVEAFMKYFSDAGPGLISSLLDKMVDALNSVADSDVFASVFTRLIGNVSGSQGSSVIDKIIGFISSNAGKVADAISKIFTPDRLANIVNAFLKSFGVFIEKSGFNFLIPTLNLTLFVIKAIAENKDAIKGLIEAFLKFNSVGQLGLQVFLKFGSIISKVLTVLTKPGFVKLSEKLGIVFNKIFSVFTRIGETTALALMTSLTLILEKFAEILTRVIIKLLENEVAINLLIGILDVMANALVFLFDNFEPLIDVAIPALVIAITALIVFAIGPLIVVLGAIVLAMQAVILVFDVIIAVLDLMQQFKGPIEILGKGILGLIVIIGILTIIAILPLVAAFLLIFGPALAFHALLLAIAVAIGILIANIFSLEDILTLLGAAFVTVGALAMLPFLAILGALLIVVLLISSPIIIATAAIIGLIFAIGLLIENFNLIYTTLIEGKDKILEVFKGLIDGLINTIPGLSTITNQAASSQDQQGSSNDQGTIQEQAGEFVEEVKNGVTEFFSNLPKLPGFATGGLVGARGIGKNSMKGQKSPGIDKDAIPIVAHKGEFVLTRKAVEEIGLNKLLAANRGQTKDRLATDLGGNIISQGNITGRDISTIASRPKLDIPKNMVPEIPENANTREYYLKNFYNPGNTGSDSTSSLNANPNSPDSGVSKPGRSGLTITEKPPTKASSGVTPTIEDKEIKIDKLEFKIDISGSNFTSEDAADKVKKSIIEELDNNKGALAGKLRDMIKGGK